MANLKVRNLFFFFVFLLSACVSKGKYLELESDLVATRQRAELGDQNLHSLQKKYETLEDIEEGIKEGIENITNITNE